MRGEQTLVQEALAQLDYGMAAREGGARALTLEGRWPGWEALC